jgi:hypothetical protein
LASYPSDKTKPNQRKANVMPYSDDETDLEDFLDELRYKIKKKADNAELYRFIRKAISGEVPAGPISSLVLDLAENRLKILIADIINGGAAYDEMLVDTIKDAEECVIEDLTNEKADVIAEKIENDLELKYQTQLMYRLAEDKFIRDPNFRHEILNRLKSDLIESKEKGDFPKLFETTIKNCDTIELFDHLLANFKLELFEFYRQDIIMELKQEHQDELLQEVKDKLYNDEQFINNAKVIIMKELASKLFE